MPSHPRVTLIRGRHQLADGSPTRQLGTVLPTNEALKSSSESGYTCSACCAQLVELHHIQSALTRLILANKGLWSTQALREVLLTESRLLPNLPKQRENRSGYGLLVIFSHPLSEIH